MGFLLEIASNTLILLIDIMRPLNKNLKIATFTNWLFPFSLMGVLTVVLQYSSCYMDLDKINFRPPKHGQSTYVHCSPIALSNTEYVYNCMGIYIH